MLAGLDILLQKMKELWNYVQNGVGRGTQKTERISDIMT